MKKHNLNLKEREEEYLSNVVNEINELLESFLTISNNLIKK